MKDIEIIDIDYSAKDPTFKKEDKVVVAKISGPWIIPEEGPVYADSVRVLKGGLDLIPGTDFEPVEEVTDLTLKTGKKVVLYIQLKQHIISGGGELDMIYQRVGLPIISTKKLIDTLEEMVIKGKPVDWDTGVTNKPATQYPSWHSHDIKNSAEMVGFGGLVELFSRLTWEQNTEGSKMQALLTQLQTEMYSKLDYTRKLKWGAIMTHSRNYRNPHGVVPGDVNSGNINNFATATPQEDSEGRRSDLRSTPAGLSRLISEASPVTEDYLVQNELPFGYYGSGIYLPPPITGSFEGLGGDIENSAFVREGNGWTVGLIRGYDGRVKNLYYVYTEDVRDRSNSSPWIHTYVQYVHPAITGAGKRANMVVSGSNQDVICLGDVAWGGDSMVKGRDQLWIGVTNSTFDPASHTLKPIDIVNKVVDKAAAVGGIYNMQAGMGTIARVGDWVYYIHSFSGATGDIPGNYLGGDQNWQQHFWRFKYSDLTNPAVTSIVLQPVNVTFDNLDRERRTNQPAFFMIKHKGTGTNVISEGALKFSRPVITADSHRRRQFLVVPNPNNKRYARVRILFVTYTTIRNIGGDGTRGLWQDLIVDYDWDVETNTWTIDKNWRKPTLDIDGPGNGTLTDINAPWNQSYSHASHTNQFVFVSGSWVPGVGYVSMGSVQTGVPPYMMSVSLFNDENDPTRDFYWANQPPSRWDSVGRFNNFRLKMVMRSPFGVAGFPRHYSDLYALTDGTRATPIEVFYAENEAQNQQYFYRIAETVASDNGYDYRETLQSDFIDRPIYGRKTNSNFGVVNGMTQNVGTTNRPMRKNERSFTAGHMSYTRTKLIANPGAAPSFTWKINESGQQVAHSIESNGDVIVNLAYDWRYDTPTKVLFCRPNANKQVRIPRSLWQDMVHSSIGAADLAKTLDYSVSFYIADQPGGGETPYSHWCVHYHTTDAPSITRTIAGIFTWSVVTTINGVRQIKFDGMQYPFNQSGNKQRPLRPGVTTNISAGPDHHAINADGTWTGVLFSTGTDVKHTHMEILDKGAGGTSNIEMCWQPGTQINVTGNMTGDKFFLRIQNGVVIEGSLGWSSNRAFNAEFSNQVFANAQHGWLNGVTSATSGGAICLLSPWNGQETPLGAVMDKYIMYGATYVEGNWSVFINSEVTVTFNGFSMMAKMQNWDLRDLSDVYKNQTFYIYCCANGSGAYYEVTKILRGHDANKILVATVKTDDFGIVTIERRQTFTISGFPITLARDMGVPASSGAVTEQGNYKFLKRSELFSG
ncbi:putative virion structural protein [Edwardsiella phage pEt-SU]|uniref:Putative virion structural protein n=1 Tax=Edwardsiella phage pEt-SU TaxID=2562142 RepID=A0A4D6DWH6_9CAUD|nr:putative virion structural protein [Edwardsiella phage pEt-SU]QBZ70664.1 putative virion structural protein [Edwardsiella phage pEt-SU]